MIQLAYYLLIRPLTLLPLPVLYYLSDFSFFVLYRLIGYRKKVVWANLRNSFPEKEEAELQQVMEDFYRHFCDIVVESLRMFTMSKEEAIRRCRAVNPEMLDDFHRQGKSVLIVAGHYGNWELAALSIGLQSEPVNVGVYHPLSNKFINDQFQQSRSRFGMKLVAKKEVKPFFEEARQNGRYAILLGADQAPHNPRKAYWTYFLGQETPIMFGTEKYAKDYGFPVVFGHVRRLGRGYYEMEFELITDGPMALPHGEISERHTRILEKDIRNHPPYWLWTHRRWKRERPADIPIHSTSSGA